MHPRESCAWRRDFSLVQLWLPLCAVAAILGSCGGGGGGRAPDAGPAGSGSVALLLTDAATDEFSEVQVTITRMELIGSERRVEFFRSAAGKTVDLLRLEGESSLFSLASEIPSGRYEKIRLQVSKVHLVQKSADGSVVELDAVLTGNGKIDLNPRGGFEVRAGFTLIVQVDIDAKKSIHVVRAGRSGKTLFRPVVFVKIIEASLEGKLVRLTGRIEELDRETGTFLLCPQGTSVHTVEPDVDVDDDPSDDGGAAGLLARPDREPVKPDTPSISGTSDGDGDEDGDGDDDEEDDEEHRRRCLGVLVSESTLVVSPEGQVIDLAALADGDRVTVIGHLRFDAEADATTAIQAELLRDRLALDAAVIEAWDPDSDVAPFRLFSGSVQTAVDAEGVFDFEIRAGEGVEFEGPVKVELVEGAKIFDRLGEELTSAELQPGMQARVDGRLFVSSAEPDRIVSPLVVLDTRAEPAPLKLEGKITAIDAALGTLTLAVAGEGGATEERCVRLADGADIFILVVDGTSFETTVGSLADLKVGDEVDVFGAADASDPDCLLAETVITASVTPAPPAG